jgi:hypothetical protein
LQEKENQKKLDDEAAEITLEQEKELALLKQEKEHLENKVCDLEQHLYEVTDEYEERANSMKNKIKDLKLQRIRDHSRDKENKNRFNTAYSFNEDKLDEFLSVGDSGIPGTGQ